MFRFGQRLSTIFGLGDKPLTPEQVSGLDHYDLELEDALSAGAGGYWVFGSGTLYNDLTTTVGINEVVVSPETTPTPTNTYLSMFDDGTPNSAFVGLATNRSGGQVDVYSDGTASLRSSTAVRVWATNAGATTDVRGASYLLLAATSAAAAGGVGVDIQALGAGTQLRLLAGSGVDIQLTVSGGGHIKMSGLPTSDPGVSGALWVSTTSAYVVKISP